MKCARCFSFLIASSLLATGVVFGQIVPEVGQSRKVCLQTWMGTFVVAEGGGGDLVLANRAQAGEWETFEMTRIGADHASLRAAKGQLVCAEYGGGGNRRGESK